MTLNSSIFSGVGQDIHRLESSKADKWELHSINSKVSDLEYSLRELRSICDDLRNEVGALREAVRRLSEPSDV